MNIIYLPEVAKEYLALFDDVQFIPFNIGFLNFTGMKHLKKDGQEMMCSQYLLVTKNNIINIPMNCLEDNNVLTNGINIGNFIRNSKVDKIVCLLRKEIVYDDTGITLNRITVIQIDDDVNLKYYVNNIKDYINNENIQYCINDKRLDNYVTAKTQYGDDRTSVAEETEKRLIDMEYM